MVERGLSVINVPIAVITGLMTSFSDRTLGARLRGARLKRLKAPDTFHQSASLQRVSFPKIGVLQIMPFTVQRSYGGSLLQGLEIGKLIVPLKQIGITPLDALMSECYCLDMGGRGVCEPIEYKDLTAFYFLPLLHMSKSEGGRV